MHIASARRMRVLAVVSATALAVLTAGCGSDDPAPATQETVSAAPAPAETSGDSGGGEDCSSAGPEINAGAQATGFVTGVEVPSCDRAEVATTLGTEESDVQSALGICSIAANEASGKGVASVVVLAEDGTELVTGTNAGDCAAA